MQQHAQSLARLLDPLNLTRDEAFNLFQCAVIVVSDLLTDVSQKERKDQLGGAPGLSSCSAHARLCGPNRLGQWTVRARVR